MSLAFSRGLCVCRCREQVELSDLSIDTRGNISPNFMLPSVHVCCWSIGSWFETRSVNIVFNICFGSSQILLADKMPRSEEAEWWANAVYEAIQEVPRGRVTSYGHIARLLGERMSQFP